MRTVCHAGRHPWSEETTAVLPGDGRRYCLECTRERAVLALAGRQVYTPQPEEATRPAGEWREHATCAGEPLRLFYGPSVEKPAAREARVAKAKAICGRCPVRTECAEDAVARGEKWGVRGGLTGTELKRERRRRMKRAVARSQVVCSCCGKTGPRGGPGPDGVLITSCRARWVRAGRPETVPPTPVGSAA